LALPPLVRFFQGIIIPVVVLELGERIESDFGTSGVG
jgi:hypothetical protein